MITDTERLDFVLEHSAFIVDHMRDDTFKQWQLWTQDEDENFIKLSGDNGYFNSPREAIDAAIRLHTPPQEGGKQS